MKRAIIPGCKLEIDYKGDESSDGGNGPFGMDDPVHVRLILPDGDVVDLGNTDEVGDLKGYIWVCQGWISGAESIEDLPEVVP